MRPSWVEIDLDAVRANAAAITAAVKPAQLCAVVKADGYGHGDVPVARAALSGGARWLGVALVTEGRRLREADIAAPILLLSEPPAADVREIVQLGLTPAVYTSDFVSALAVAADEAEVTGYPVHLKVNTGMHRVGADPANAIGLARVVAGDPRLRLQGVWTHFAVAEEDEGFTKAQSEALAAFRSALEAEGVNVPLLHAANTAGALSFPETRFDMVRVGLGLYGLRPAPHVGLDVPLLPAMRVVSHVSMIRRLPAGERPSYGRARPLESDSTVATVPVGYADGVARRLSSVGGDVLIRGARYPFAGTVTMDQVVVDVGDDAVEVGDEVILLGPQGEEMITADGWAGLLDTINYEIVCGFGPRLPRRYRGNP